MERRLIGVALAALVATACATGGGSRPSTPTNPPPTTTPSTPSPTTTPQRVTVWGKDAGGLADARGVLIIDTAIDPVEAQADASGVLTFLIDPKHCGHGAALTVRAGDAWAPASGRVVLADCQTGDRLHLAEGFGSEYPDVVLQAARHGRRGVVRLDRRVTVDDDGPFPALGVSLFWALWGEKVDPARLDANLAAIAGKADFVRILGQVDWPGQDIDPRAADYWPTVDALFARLARHGLRAEVTVFGGVRSWAANDKARAIEQWRAYAQAHATQVILVEAANEHWQNGVEVGEARAFGRALMGAGPLVALSSANGSWCDLYAGAGVNVATVHYERDSRSNGPYRPIRQPWGFPDEYDGNCRGQLPTPWNNEPIGIASSVADDDDPRRLVSAYLTTFVASNAAYVLHSGAGIYGRDYVTGQGVHRFANLQDQPTFAQALDGMVAIRARLPQNLANWDRQNAQWAGHPFDGFAKAIDDGGLVRAYAATSASGFVVSVVGLARAVPVVARRPMHVEVVDLLTGGTIEAVDLAGGQGWTLARYADGVLILGSYR